MCDKSLGQFQESGGKHWCFLQIQRFQAPWGVTVGRTSQLILFDYQCSNHFGSISQIEVTWIIMVDKPPTVFYMFCWYLEVWILHLLMDQKLNILHYMVNERERDIYMYIYIHMYGIWLFLESGTLRRPHFCDVFVFHVLDSSMCVSCYSYYCTRGPLTILR